MANRDPEPGTLNPELAFSARTGEGRKMAGRKMGPEKRQLLNCLD